MNLVSQVCVGNHFLEKVAWQLSKDQRRKPGKQESGEESKK